MAVIFIYLVLASQFGSFTQLIAIMAALPLSPVGALLGLMVTGSTINMFSMIGFIMLMGLVTKNGILLIDFVNRERRKGSTLLTLIVVPVILSYIDSLTHWIAGGVRTYSVRENKLQSQNSAKQ